MSKRLIQAVEKARHEMLAVDQLKELGSHLVNVALHYQPVVQDPETGKWRANPAADVERFEMCMKLGLDVLKALAPFQSPKLQAVMIQQEKPKQQRVRLTVDIFNEQGQRLERLVDGHPVVEGEAQEIGDGEARGGG
jgi:hypothetical protein